ncbi:MAG: hypothetical protein KC912_06345 [Proteobacteria bacterium]|nr:hypothetical protein [Pseudomonadota bacterium]
MSHISPKQIDDALAGDVGALSVVVAHVEGGCEPCESLLDGVDLDTLALLVAASEAPPVEPTAAESAQIRPDFGAAAFRPTRWLAPVLLVAVALFAVVQLAVPPASVDGIKGSEVARPDVAVQVLVGVASAAGFKLERRLEANGELSRDATLLFELDTKTASARYLFVLDGEGEATLLFPGDAAAVEGPGPRRVGVGEDWVAFALDDWAGPITVVAAASQQPHPAADVIEAYASRRATPGIGFADVSAVVVP